jgi:uncharacterized delta-60 repeat protein
MITYYRRSYTKRRASSSLPAIAFLGMLLLLVPAISSGLARSRAFLRSAAQQIRPQGTGDLDPSFGNQGVVQISVSNNGTTPKSIAVQSDGKIVVGGQYGTVSAGSSTVIQHSFLVRLNTDGSLDTSFGKSGIATFNLNAAGDGINVVKLQGDGKILFAGFVSNSSGGTTFMVGRASTTGSIDTTFGSKGFANHPGGQALCMDLALNGEMVVGGEMTGNLADLVVITSTGASDPNYPHSTLLTSLNSVQKLASVTGVLWQFNAGGQGNFGPRIPGEIVVTGPTLSGGVEIADLAVNIDGTLGTGPHWASTFAGPVSASVIGGGLNEVAWAYSGAVLSPINSNSVVPTSLLDATGGSPLGNSPILSVPNQNLEVQAISVYSGPQGVDSGGTVFADGDVLMGGAITSSDGTSSVGALAVLDTNLNFTDGSSAIIQYPQLTGITALAPFSTESSIGVYLLGTGVPASAAGIATVGPSAPPTEQFFIERSRIEGMPCSPPLNLLFYGSGPFILEFGPPPGEVGGFYGVGLFVKGSAGGATVTVSGNLPPGLTFDGTSGTLKGTPTEAGTFPVTFRVTDDRGCTFSITETITIKPNKSPLIISASLVKNGLELIGLGFLNSSHAQDLSLAPQAGKPVILINGVVQKTKPGPMGADTDLIAPKGGKIIPIGATVTIQVRTPGGTLTNSIVVTRTQ